MKAPDTIGAKGFQFHKVRLKANMVQMIRTLQLISIP